MNEKVSINDIIYFILLLSFAVVSFFYYGAKVAALLAAACVTAYITDILCYRIKKEKNKFLNMYSLSQALALTLMVPVSISYPLLVVSVIFMTVIGSHILNNTKKLVIPSAAIGYIFMLIFRRSEVSSYPDITGNFGYDSYAAAELHQSLSERYNATGILTNDVLDVLIGNTAGPVGTGIILLSVLSVLILVILRKVRPAPVLGMLAAVGVLGGMVNKSGNYINSGLFEICANMVIFASVFLIAADNNSPSNFLSGLLYGLTTGMVTYYLTFFTETENAVIPAIVICSPVCLLCRSLDIEKRPVKKAAKKPEESIDIKIENIDHVKPAIEKVSEQKIILNTSVPVQGVSVQAAKPETVRVTAAGENTEAAKEIKAENKAAKETVKEPVKEAEKSPEEKPVKDVPGKEKQPSDKNFELSEAEPLAENKPEDNKSGEHDKTKEAKNEAK